MDSSPEASRLVLLSQLPQAGAGTKVRFLGWYVQCQYNSRTTHILTIYKV
jgi:hypothetical protein